MCYQNILFIETIKRSFAGYKKIISTHLYFNLFLM